MPRTEMNRTEEFACGGEDWTYLHKAWVASEEHCESSNGIDDSDYEMLDREEIRVFFEKGYFA